MYWTDLAQDRDEWWAIVNTVMKLLVSGNFLTGLETVSFSGRTLLREVT